jgi:hypothetical protein
MSETPLESLRRQIQKAEERLKNTGDLKTGDKSTTSTRDPRKSAIATKKQPRPVEAQQPTAASEWIAYGQMTPGLLAEISNFIADSIRGNSGQLHAQDKPDLTKLLHGIERARSVIQGWADSSLFLPAIVNQDSHADLVQRALNVRKAELSRWRIKAEFEDATTVAETCDYSPALFKAVLHVIQFCAEQLRGNSGESRLFVRVQNTGERLETAFLCETAGISKPAESTMQPSSPYEPLNSRNLELRAAQKLLDPIGGTLVLENMSDSRQAVKIYLSGSANSIDRGRSEESRNR